MPTKNLPKKSTNSFLQLLKTRKNPILAVLVVLAVVSVGYFGYVYSSADTVNYARLKNNCRVRNLTDTAKKEACIAKVTEQKDAADVRMKAKAALKIDCQQLKRFQTSTTSCGNCYKAYTFKDLVCVKREKIVHKSELQVQPATTKPTTPTNIQAR